MKIMALDIGDVRVGIAVSDLLKIIANPRETYVRKDLRLDVQYFCQLAADEGVSEIVLGLPVNMDGSSGERVSLIKQFGQSLSSAMPNIKISYLDERLTSQQAEKVLDYVDSKKDKRVAHADIKKQRRKGEVDKMAACIILQNYLDKISLKGENYE